MRNDGYLVIFRSLEELQTKMLNHGLIGFQMEHQNWKGFHRKEIPRLYWHPSWGFCDYPPGCIINGSDDMLIARFCLWEVLDKVHSPSIKWQWYWWNRTEWSCNMTGWGGFIQLTLRTFLNICLYLLSHLGPPIPSSNQINNWVEFQVSKPIMKPFEITLSMSRK